MPRYSYFAKSSQGEPKVGSTDAKDEYELARILRQEGYVLISANLEEEEKRKKFTLSSITNIIGVPLSDKLMFTRNLEVMISSGVPLPRSIKILSEQAKSKKFHNALIEVSEELVRGKSFSETLAKYPDIFSELYCSMIKIGEESGSMETSLKNLSFQMEREYELISKVKGALIYPAVIISAMTGIGIMMLVMVVPKLAETFKELNVELPVTTRFVILIGTFLVEKWYVPIILAVALFITLRLASKTRGGSKVIDKLILKLPIISPIIKTTNTARTIRTFSTLIASGIPIVRALEVVAYASSNFYFKKALLEAAEKARKGGKISDALKPYENIFSLLVIQMIEVGEETGQTSDVLSKLADFFETEVTNATKNLASVIEPILMLIIGAAVGFFAVSMIQPMYSMLGGIK